MRFRLAWIGVSAGIMMTGLGGAIACAQDSPALAMVQAINYSLPASVAESLMDQPSSDEAEKAIPKIIGGQPAKKGEFPWQVAIILAKAPATAPFKGLYCGGTLIAWDWVLTAAHCTFKDNPKGRDHPPVPMKPSDLKVYFGSHDFSTGKIATVADIVREPNYNLDTADNDVALLNIHAIKEKDQKDIGLEVLQLVGSNVEDALQPKKYGRILGWGSTRKGVLPDDKRELVRTLMHVRVEFQNKGDCNAHHLEKRREDERSYQRSIGRTAGQIKSLLDKLYPPSRQLVTENMICAGTGDGSGDACLGDSGGPLVIQMGAYLQAGIVSWGPYQGCGLTNLFGVYALLPRYLDWIQEKTGIKVK